MSDEIGTILEVECVLCKGRGKESVYECGPYRERGDCRCCGGSGYTTTELGEAVLQLMRHHFRPLYEDLIEKR